MDISVDRRSFIVFFLFWKTVSVSYTKFVGQLINSNHWIKSLGVDYQRLKYSITLERFQIITRICVEIDFLWMFDRRVASFFKHFDHESRFLYFGWENSSTTKPKHYSESLGISEQMLFHCGQNVKTSRFYSMSKLENFLKYKAKMI